MNKPIFFIFLLLSGMSFSIKAENYVFNRTDSDIELGILDEDGITSDVVLGPKEYIKITKGQFPMPELQTDPNVLMKVRWGRSFHSMRGHTTIAVPVTIKNFDDQAKHIIVIDKAQGGHTPWTQRLEFTDLTPQQSATLMPYGMLVTKNWNSHKAESW